MDMDWLCFISFKGRTNKKLKGNLTPALRRSDRRTEQRTQADAFAFLPRSVEKRSVQRRQTGFLWAEMRK